MSDELVCGFCSQNIEALALSQREDHYEAHFLAFGNESVTTGVRAESSRQSATGKDKLNHKPWKNLGKKLENDVFWYPSLGIPPPRNYTPGDMPMLFSPRSNRNSHTRTGLMPLIRQSLDTLCINGKVIKAVLCHEKVVHISKEFWDAQWGCG